MVLLNEVAQLQIKPKPKKKKIKTKKKKTKKALNKERPDSLKVPDLPTTDQATRFVSAIEDIYGLALSSSFAAAIVELKLVKESIDDDEEGGEIEDRFSKALFTELQEKFLELKAVKGLGSAFGLDNKYLDQIMSVRIEALFGKKIQKGESKSAFFGNEEEE